MQNDEIETKKTHKKSRKNKSEPTQVNSTNPPFATWNHGKKIELQKKDLT
jgi:hypothetical protein